MRKVILKILVSSILSSTAFAGGIPVIDTTSLAQQIAQVEHMVRQVEQLQQQITIANKELNNMTGSRGLGGIIDSAYDKSVNVNPNNILQNAGIKNASQMGLEDELADIYNAKNTNTARWLAQSQKSLEQSKQRFNELTGLLDKVNDSPEQKDILDLQARIGAEQTLLQNESIKLSMLKSQTEAQNAIQEQKLLQRRAVGMGEMQGISLD